MRRTLDRIIASGLQEIRGARIDATIPISERLINEILNEEFTQPGRVLAFEIRVGANNEIDAGVRIAVGPFTKWVRAVLVVEPVALPGGNPMIALRIASGLGVVSKIIELFASSRLPPGVRLAAGRITIDLNGIPAAQPYRQYWRMIRRLEIVTRPHLVVIDAVLQVD